MKISIRLTELVSTALAVACSSGTEGGPAGNTELNLDIVNPGGTSGELGFTVDRVDYRITCDGNPGAAIAPSQYVGSAPDYTPCNADADCALEAVCVTTADAAAIGAPSAGLCAIPTSYDDSVDITGQFEILDDRTPPVWQAVMDLPPGDCTVSLTVSNPDGEIVCSGSELDLIVEDGLTKYDIVLICSLSVDLPDGMADIDGEFLFVTGNLCPKTYLLNSLQNSSDVLLGRAEIQFRAKDPDDGCGSNCDPQICTGANPPVCTPSDYNPADARCLAAAGGGLTCAENTPGGLAFCPLCDPTNPLFGIAPGDLNPCCQGFDYTGVGGPNVPGADGTVCSIVALPTATPGVPGGTFISPLPPFGPVGPFIPVNISDAFNDGTDIHIQGTDIDYRCDPALPGDVTLVMTCTDGDVQCDQQKVTTINCPGVDFFCFPGECAGSSECLTDALFCSIACNPSCDPSGPSYNATFCCSAPAPTDSCGLDECDRCPGQDVPIPAGTSCTEGGGNVCDGAGACVECLTDADCADLPATPVECQLANTCNVGTNLCEPGGAAPAGTACDLGSGPGFYACNGLGTGPSACEFIFGSNPVTAAITLGCTNNLTTAVSILPWELTADAGPLLNGSPSTIDYTGLAIFTEAFLDAGLAAVPGLTRAGLAPGNRGGATIVPKAGLTGGDAAGLEIEPAPIPTTCAGGMNAGGACTSQADCPPVGYFDCLEIFRIPIIDGTGDACAACNALGAPKDTQCANNGFCIAPGGLPIPLDNVTGNYTNTTAPEVLLGWDETNQAGINPDGTYILNGASFAAPWQPGGLRVLVGILQVALNCVMAVDSDGPDGVGVPDQASPTPNSALLSLPVQNP